MGARGRGEGGSDKGRVKVRVIEFEMDGSNATLRDSIRDIVGAIGRAPQFVRQPNSAALPPATDGGNGGSVSAGDGEDTTDADAEFSREETEDERPARSKNRTIRSPQILEIDLVGGDKSLKAFVQEIAPDSEPNKYVTIAYWYKTHRGISEVNGDHMHTAIRHLGWQTPDDAAQPLRYSKARPYNYFNKGSKKGSYAINHIGENKVMELLQKGGKGA